MIIDKIDSSKMVNAYGVGCQEISVDSSANQPLEMVYCEIKPGDATKAHAHWELEKFIIIKGSGLMLVDGDTREVCEGDVVTLPAFSAHRLTNTSLSEILALVSVYSNRTIYNNPPKSLNVFSPPATPNGSLHLGHVSGPYFAADVIKRYAAVRGSNVQHISATDDHQSYVAYQAMLEKKPVARLNHEYRERIRDALVVSNIECDVFHNPAGDHVYQQFVQDFFTRLKETNSLICKSMPVPYCDDCAQYLVEANVSGHCPSCHQGISGHCCESCGFVADTAGGVVDPHCNDCASPASYKTVERYFFPMSHYRDALEGYLSGVVKNAKLTHFIENQLKNTWEDIPVTMPSSWGISVPVKTEQPQTLHVWFEMAAAFYYYQQKNTSDAVYCFGFDNSFYYALYNPALIMAFDPNAKLPGSFVCNEYYLLRQEKFSTSRRHAIWAQDAMREESVDAMRWYIAKTRPERAKTNFDMSQYHAFCQGVIEHKFNNWIEALNAHVENHEGQFSTVAFGNPLLRAFYMRLTQYINEAEKHYGFSDFSLNTVAAILERLLDDAIEFTRYQRDLCLSLTALKAFVLIASPIMPAYCEKVAVCFSPNSLVWSSDISCVCEKPALKIPPLVTQIHEVEHAH
jgi:methionyl-tRNA synthetase